MQVLIVIPAENKDSAEMQTEDQIQGRGDGWRKPLGHVDLSKKIHDWALGALETGIWPKSQMVGGNIADVIGVAQTEVNRIREEKQSKSVNKPIDLLQVVQQQVDITKYQTRMKWSTNSGSSDGSNEKTDEDNVGSDILANIGIGAGNGGDDGDGGGSGDSGGNQATSERLGGFGGHKRGESILVNK